MCQTNTKQIRCGDIHMLKSSNVYTSVCRLCLPVCLFVGKACPCLHALIAHLSMWSFCAKSCQSLPLTLAVSKVAQIRCRIERGILKALDPVWEVTVQSDCVKNGTVSFSLWRNKALVRQIRSYHYKWIVNIVCVSVRAVKANPLTRVIN